MQNSTGRMKSPTTPKFIIPFFFVRYNDKVSVFKVLVCRAVEYANLIESRFHISSVYFAILVWERIVFSEYSLIVPEGMYLTT
jgi:hypothetical protein